MDVLQRAWFVRQPPRIATVSDADLSDCSCRTLALERRRRGDLRPPPPGRLPPRACEGALRPRPDAVRGPRAARTGTEGVPHHRSAAAALRRRPEATAGFDVRGSVWSDAGAADPVAAAEWVWNRTRSGARHRDRQPWRSRGRRLRRPRRPSLRGIPLVHSVRVRLAAGVVQGAHPDGPARPRRHCRGDERPVGRGLSGWPVSCRARGSCSTTSVGRPTRSDAGTPDLPRSLRRVGGELERGHPPRRDRDDLRGMDPGSGAPVVARDRGSVRSRPVHARLQSADRAPVPELCTPVPRLRREHRRTRTPRPRNAAAGHRVAVLRAG